ncbi:lipoate--protein ligase family protein [Paeniglutamicibacter cryotolerans]|uniref:Lipoate-protein ligase A n=1 Tax=Paeniglutamicibacter cryotolerans TaxID=670079 RepID=A0A839QYI5_9MICC|nr:lipoate--protein ligase family protein [Paeniglutamicibacter cryotolerans]MBB2997021.1 lipoate-protein ligase A [Paeniglutamicibacter cryotolerans]
MSAWNSEPGLALRIIEAEASGDPAADLHTGVELLGEVRSGVRGATLRFYRPDPTLAFGQRDVRLTGYAAAVETAGRLGFAPLVRKAGGRAAAYHRGTLIVDHVEPHSEAMLGHQERFRVLGGLYASALRSLGVDAAVGELAGEYCPGEFSVHGNPGPGSGLGSPVKLVGTAQRVVAGAWLFSSVFVVNDSAPIRSVLDGVYQDLGLAMDPSTAGAVDDLVPGVDVGQVRDALLAAYGRETELT